MSKGHPNLSWREQRKGVRMTEVESGTTVDFISLWQASHRIALTAQCDPATARKEIKKAIRSGCHRYGAVWRWNDKSE